MSIKEELQQTIPTHANNDHLKTVGRTNNKDQIEIKITTPADKTPPTQTKTTYSSISSPKQ